MSREAKGKLTIIVALLFAVFGASLAGTSLALAQSASQPTLMSTPTYSAPYIDVTRVPIVFKPASQPAPIAKAAPPARTLKGPDDATGLFGFLRKAVKEKQWGLALAAALALLVLGLRLGAGRLQVMLDKGTRLQRFLAWCQTDRGGAWLVLLSGALTGVLNALGGGQALTVDLLFDSAALAAGSSTGAAGLYALIKKIGWPSDKRPATV